MLRIPPTHIDRGIANKKAQEMLIEQINAQSDKDITIHLPSETINQRKLKLLGHIIRADQTDPIRQVTFENESVRPRFKGYRRVGKPRLNWTKNNIQKVWKIIEPTADANNKYDFDNILHQNKILQTAKDREPPFD